MELPIKYMLLGNNPTFPSFIFEIKIVPITTELQLVFNFYQLKTKLTDAIRQSIDAADSNSEFMDRISKQLVFSKIFTMKQSEELAFLLNNTVARISGKDPNQPIALTLTSDLKNIQMLPSQIYGLFLFVQQFILSYNIFKHQYFSSQPVQQTPIQPTVTPPVEINRPVLSIVEKDEVKDIDIELKDTELIKTEEIEENLLEVGLNQALSLCKDNVLQYYLIKYINIYLNNNQIEQEYDIKIENNQLILCFEQLIPNNLLFFSQRHYSDLILMLDHIKIAKEEIVSILLFCIDQIIFICNKYISNKEKYRKDVHILLKLYEYIFFLYNLKYNPDQFNEVMNGRAESKVYGFNFVLATNVQTILNYGLKQSSKYHNLPYSSMVIQHPRKWSYVNENLADLKEIINKNKYISNLQNNEMFINEVLKNLDNKESTRTNKEIELIYNNQRLIKIDNLITNKEKNEHLLEYSLIDISNYKILEGKKILSREYLELLLLQLKDPNLKSKDLSKLVKNYSQLIIKDILTPISDKYNSLKQPISSIDILLTYIRPSLDKFSSVNLELEILYRIVIPFLYDNFNIREFIDCFH